MGKSLAQSKTAWALGLLGLLASGSLTAPIAAIAQVFGLAASPETLNGLVTIAGVVFGLYGRENATQPITGIITPGKAS